MNLNRAQVIDANLVGYLRDWAAQHPGATPTRSLDSPVRDGHILTGREMLALFDAQMISRHLDLIARELRGRDAGYYTIGSAGHEGNAVLGRLVRHTDPAFLHYRSGALMIQRAKHLRGETPVWNTLLSQAASREDPIAGGRHKVWGSVPLWVLPQTSTIASHLPKAVGTAIAIERANHLHLPLPIPDDSIVLCTFGDASANHSVAAGAFNTAAWVRHQRLPLPILFVCEDNGIGISVHTPNGWIESTFGFREGLRYVACNGLEYHTLDEIAAVEAHDPLLYSARTLLEAGMGTAEQLLEMYESIRARVRGAAAEVVRRPKLSSAREVMEPLAPYTPDAVMAEAVRAPDAAARLRIFGEASKLPESQRPRHLKVLINWALHDAMIKYPQCVLFGEDVAKKGGVYNVTTGLTRTFGVSRCFNTLLDETTILGLAIGFGHMGFLPMPEIQYLAYYHNAEDQIRGEACSQQFFSRGQFRNPMVVRIAGLAYQKGFGGHFHNDNSIAALRDVPGLVIAIPSRGDDAVEMLRTCLALAKVDGRVCVFIEPIALYMTKDLHSTGDGQWQFEYPALDRAAPLGSGRTYFEDARDLSIITYGNGLYMSLRAARTLEEQYGIRARVADLRWLAPLNEDFIESESRATGRVLVVDECRRSGGPSEAIITAIVARCGSSIQIARVAAHDTYIPLGPAANTVLPQESDIVAAARNLVPAPRGERPASRTATPTGASRGAPVDTRG
ncbi:MAG: thiamine pyrophosphate-dependent enzyme [Phycisphaerae bacterium]|nr:thiamine pyrophosphate-dependent enzyme [Phycisphaerae bacterium]